MAGISLSRRAIALIVAVVLAAVATVALVSYVQSAHNKGLLHPVSAYVAKQTITAGTDAATILSKGLIERKNVDQSVLPADAITSLDQIQGEQAVVDIQQNEIIIASRFKSPSQITNQPGSSFASNIPAGMQAVSIEVNTIPGVANFIQPGDNVSVLLQLAQTGATGQVTQVKYLLQNLKVLQVGVKVIVPPQNGQPGGTAVQQQTGKVDLTLAVTPAQAEKIVFGTLNGTLYFTLVPQGQKPANTPGRNGKNEFSR